MFNKQIGYASKIVAAAVIGTAAITAAAQSSGMPTEPSTCDDPEIVGRITRLYRASAAELSMEVEIEVKAPLAYKLNSTAEPSQITDNSGNTWKPRNGNLLLQSGVFMSNAKRKITYKLFNESGAKDATSLNVLLGFRAFSPEGGSPKRCRFEFTGVPLGSR